jgi:SAM-dependent methyltransferase
MASFLCQTTHHRVVVKAVLNTGTTRKTNDLVPESVIRAEAERIVLEYHRRSKASEPDQYAPWQIPRLLNRNEVCLVAARMLHRAGRFPVRGDACLEIGFGGLGWLGELIEWNLRERDLHGIELDLNRAAYVQDALPAADLRVGDATHLPWPEATFQLVIASTVFTSILSEQVRCAVAAEITRVLAPGGALLWYDFFYNNPRNLNVRKVSRQELRSLFPSLVGEVKSVTLAPPVARFVSQYSVLAAQALATIPWLRTHLLAVLLKQPT